MPFLPNLLKKAPPLISLSFSILSLCFIIIINLFEPISISTVHLCVYFPSLECELEEQLWYLWLTDNYHT